jgi:hypothetical protein
MNQIVGWILVAVAVTAGWLNYGWQGAVVTLTVSVFWLLLQFNRAIKVMKNAGHAPVGYVASAVMLNAKLKPRMAMMQVIGLTKSLGRQTGTAPETWVWTDNGGSFVTLVMNGGRLASWQLTRPAEPETSPSQADALPASSPVRPEVQEENGNAPASP